MNRRPRPPRTSSSRRRRRGSGYQGTGSLIHLSTQFTASVSSSGHAAASTHASVLLSRIEGGPLDLLCMTNANPRSRLPTNARRSQK
jgi:hypothetical protein